MSEPLKWGIFETADCPKCGSKAIHMKSWDTKNPQLPSIVHLYKCPTCGKRIRRVQQRLGPEPMGIPSPEEVQEFMEKPSP